MVGHRSIPHLLRRNIEVMSLLAAEVLDVGLKTMDEGDLEVEQAFRVCCIHPLKGRVERKVCLSWVACWEDWWDRWCDDHMTWERCLELNGVENRNCIAHEPERVVEFR